MEPGWDPCDSRPFVFDCLSRASDIACTDTNVLHRGCHLGHGTGWIETPWSSHGFLESTEAPGQTSLYKSLTMTSGRIDKIDVP